MPCQRGGGVESTSTVLNAAEVCNELITTIDSTMFHTLMRNTSPLVSKYMPTVRVWACEHCLITILPWFFIFFLGFCFLKSTPTTREHSKGFKPSSRLTMQ